MNVPRLTSLGWADIHGIHSKWFRCLRNGLCCTEPSVGSRYTSRSYIYTDTPMLHWCVSIRTRFTIPGTAPNDLGFYSPILLHTNSMLSTGKSVLPPLLHMLHIFQYYYYFCCQKKFVLIF